MTTLELLRATRDLLADERRWRQHNAATDLDGEPKRPDDPNARLFCTVGGLSHAASLLIGRDDAPPATEAAITALQRTLGRPGIAKFNDTRTHAEVLALFDKTITRLEREELVHSYAPPTEMPETSEAPGFERVH